MLINENRLNLMDARHRKYLAEQVEKHAFRGSADQDSGLRAAAGLRAEMVARSCHGGIFGFENWPFRTVDRNRLFGVASEKMVLTPRRY